MDHIQPTEMVYPVSFRTISAVWSNVAVTVNHLHGMKVGLAMEEVLFEDGKEQRQAIILFKGMR